MPVSPDMEGFWVHFVETVYGAWLYGDARGFRTRHHREHVEGDYKAPPPAEKYNDRRQRSAASLKQPPVVLEPAWRPIVGQPSEIVCKTSGSSYSASVRGANICTFSPSCPSRRTRAF